MFGSRSSFRSARGNRLAAVLGAAALSLALAAPASAEAGAASVPNVRANDPLSLATSSGFVRGIDTGTTREWRGIPYIAPPLGELRWRPPQPPTSWDGTRDATTFGPHCIQLASPDTVEGSEDCVYLNVFAPATAPTTPLPVMVHLHGGRNSAFWAYTDAEAFTSRGVIVVTLEYRMGVFGFVGHPLLTAEGAGTSGEYGMLDQVAALRWVKDNIAAFGGDPANVTLFGESAGSFDATALVASPLAQGLFHRAALQTESFWALNGLGKISDAESWGVEGANVVRCSDAPDILACLRATPAEDLVLALGFLDLSPWVGGAVLPDSPLALIQQQSATIPLLIGSNREEAAFFFSEVFTGEAYRPNLYYRDTNALAGPQAGRIVRRLYPADDYDSNLWASVAAFTDAVYTCPMRRLGLASSGPVWRYLYTHRLENDPFLAGLRASHFLDEPILWHDPELVGGYPFSEAEEALSDAMTTYWTNFAKTGDPNSADVPAWPAYSSSVEQVLVLDDPIGVIEDWRVSQCTFFDRLPDLFPPAWLAARFWAEMRERTHP